MSGFVWENEQYLYSFYLLYTTISKWSECSHTSGVWRVCERALAHAAFTRGVGVMLDGGRVWSVVLTRRHSYDNQSHTSLVLHERDWVFAWGDLIGWRLRWRLKSCVSTTLQTRPPSSVDADAPCECSVSRAHAHTSHTGLRVRTQITWTWLCTRGKKIYKYCSFSHTNRSFRVLGHQCCSYDGELFNLDFSVHVFFPLIETVTYTCHYMTDRLERFDLKTSKLDLLTKKRHLHLGCPWGKLIYIKFYSKWTIPLSQTTFSPPRSFIAQLSEALERKLPKRGEDIAKCAFSNIPVTMEKWHDSLAIYVLFRVRWRTLNM